MISKIATPQSLPVVGSAADAPAASATTPAAGDTTPDKSSHAPSKDTAAAKPPAAPPAEPLLRLEIKDKGDGRFVYALTDRNTGQLVVEIPREALAQLASDPNYSAGDVVSTKA